MNSEKNNNLVDMYQIAHYLSNHEGDLIWSRFNAFIVVHTIFFAILAQILNSETFILKPVSLRIISLVGFLLTFLWLVSTKRGYESIEFWNLSAREIGDTMSQKNVEVNLLKKGEDYFTKNMQVRFKLDNGTEKIIQRSCFTQIAKVDTEWTAYFSIFLFLLLYFLIFVLSFFI